MNQVLTREEVAALLQGLAEAASDRRELGQAKQAKHPDNLYKTKANRKVKRCYLVGSRPMWAWRGGLPALSRRRW